MAKPAIIPYGCWPAQMNAQFAAGYVGEASVDTFLRHVREGEYPEPIVDSGKRKLWLKDDLDKAINRPQVIVADLAEDL
jgi:hypothetical protein